MTEHSPSLVFNLDWRLQPLTKVSKLLYILRKDSEYVHLIYFFICNIAFPPLIICPEHKKMLQNQTSPVCMSGLASQASVNVTQVLLCWTLAWMWHFSENNLVCFHDNNQCTQKNKAVLKLLCRGMIEATWNKSPLASISEILFPSPFKSTTEIQRN